MPNIVEWRQEVFEMWLRVRIERIRWKERVTNEPVAESRRLLGERLMRDVIDVGMDGKTPKGNKIVRILLENK